MNERASEVTIESRKSVLLRRRAKLFKAMIAPLAIDLLLSFGAIPFFAAGGTLIEEIIEYFISKYFSNRAVDIELSNTDKLFGLLPFPGVTAFNVRCAREIYSIHKELKTLG